MLAVLSLMGIALSAVMMVDPFQDEAIDPSGNAMDDGGDQSAAKVMKVDTLAYPETEAIDTDDSNDGVDITVGSQDADDLKGGDESDVLLGGVGDDVIRGEDGDDLLFGQAGANSISGGDGDDEIFAMNGEADILDGGAGDDLIYADEGDTMTGGEGCDTFVIREGADGVVTDFDPKTDWIEVQYSGIERPILSTAMAPDGLQLLANDMVVATLGNLSELDLSTVTLIAG